MHELPEVIITNVLHFGKPYLYYESYQGTLGRVKARRRHTERVAASRFKKRNLLVLGVHSKRTDVRLIKDYCIRNRRIIDLFNESLSST